MSQQQSSLRARLPTLAPLALLGCAAAMLLVGFVVGSASESAVDESEALALGFGGVFMILGSFVALPIGLLATLLRRRPALSLALGVCGGVVVLVALPWSLVFVANGSWWTLIGLVVGLLVGVALVGLAVAAYVVQRRYR